MNHIKKIIAAGMLLLLLCILGMTDPNTANGASGSDYYNYVRAEYTHEDIKIDWEHEHRNAGSTADNMTFTVSRILSFTGNLRGQDEINALYEKVTYKGEIGYGNSTTFTTSVTYNCAPQATSLCRYGSKRVITRGTMQCWRGDMLISSRMVYATYTYRSYSDKIQSSL